MEHASNLGNERGIFKRDRVGVCEAAGVQRAACTHAGLPQRGKQEGQLALGVICSRVRVSAKERKVTGRGDVRGTENARLAAQLTPGRRCRGRVLPRWSRRRGVDDQCAFSSDVQLVSSPRWTLRACWRR
jgi:hypothetical protein